MTWSKKGAAGVVFPILPDPRVCVCVHRMKGGGQSKDSGGYSFKSAAWKHLMCIVMRQGASC